jgi:hypothetical protein
MQPDASIRREKKERTRGTSIPTGTPAHRPHTCTHLRVVRSQANGHIPSTRAPFGDTRTQLCTAFESAIRFEPLPLSSACSGHGQRAHWCAECSREKRVRERYRGGRRDHGRHGQQAVQPRECVRSMRCANGTGIGRGRGRGMSTRERPSKHTSGEHNRTKVCERCTTLVH